jgi:hypothetical protein
MQADRGIGPSSAADGQIQDIAALTLARDLRELPLAQRQAPMSATTWRSTLGLPTAAHGPRQGSGARLPQGALRAIDPYGAAAFLADLRPAPPAAAIHANRLTTHRGRRMAPLYGDAAHDHARSFMDEA